ncbi:aldehyde dehydrogenase family protein [Streptomyces sp. NBC_01643]|uniref:aldehyde dehydrogenase family protein n=1 Tax=Streptomyces sp. NBC_01643 TaxID=2975906 RepID=UPI002F912BE4|nr:aldehyde dehydrogenase family protein [Streptomyces sp. NBC_01643]
MTATTTTSGLAGDADASVITQLETLFAAQNKAFRSNGAPSIEERRAHLGSLAQMLFVNRERIQQALISDFAVHPKQFTDLAEVLGIAGQAMYASEHLEEWAAPEERFIDPQAFGSAQAMIHYQPKGVVGVISPWNLPFLLSLGPVVDMLAAGNRVIIKPSEHTPACSTLLQEMIAETFESDHVAVVCGGLELAKSFPKLAWDHLLYTGNSAVGREIALAAAQNLVPVTLELGGKNPVIVHSDSVNAETVAQIIGCKMVKNGQLCITPDYCLVPRDQVAEFVELAKKYLADCLPGYAGSSDCVGVVSDRHLDRLIDMLQEAGEQGGVIVDLEPGAQVNRDTRQMPMSIVLDPPDDVRVMQEEIFGPILPIKSYDSIDEAIEYVNSGERPLGLYVFTEDQSVAEHVLDRTVSGGACVNTCAIQGSLPSLGFGGSGASGYGRHRGIEGFREFSNTRGVVVRGENDAIAAFFPPYAGLAQAIVSAAFGDE